MCLFYNLKGPSSLSKKQTTYLSVHKVICHSPRVPLSISESKFIWEGGCTTSKRRTPAPFCPWVYCQKSLDNAPAPQLDNLPIYVKHKPLQMFRKWISAALVWFIPQVFCTHPPDLSVLRTMNQGLQDGLVWGWESNVGDAVWGCPTAFVRRTPAPLHGKYD